MAERFWDSFGIVFDVSYEERLGGSSIVKLIDGGVSFSVMFVSGKMDWFCASVRFRVSFDAMPGKVMFWVSFRAVFELSFVELSMKGVMLVELSSGNSIVVFVMFVSTVVLVPVMLVSVMFVMLISTVVLVMFDSAVAFFFFMNSLTRSPFWSFWSAPFSIFMLPPLGVEMVAKSPAASFVMLIPFGENDGGWSDSCCSQPGVPQAGPSAVKMVLKSRMNANRYTVRSLPTGFKMHPMFKKVSWRIDDINLPKSFGSSAKC